MVLIGLGRQLVHFVEAAVLAWGEQLVEDAAAARARTAAVAA
jgi:hypothetical protein